jgi:hypothetical protein
MTRERASFARASILAACLIVPGAAMGQGLDRASVEALARKVLPLSATCNNSELEVLCWYERDGFHASFRAGGGRYFADSDGSPAVMVVVSYNDGSANNEARQRLPLDIGQAFGYGTPAVLDCLDRASQVMDSKQGADRSDAQDQLPRIRSGTHELRCDFEMARDRTPYTHVSVLVVTAAK